MKLLRFIFTLLLSVSSFQFSLAIKQSADSVKSVSVEVPDTTNADIDFYKHISKIHRLDDADVCRKYNDVALYCSNYILRNSCYGNNFYWIMSMKFVSTWLADSEDVMVDFSTDLDECWMGNSYLTAAFMASCTKFNLTDEEEKLKPDYSKRMHVWATTRVVEYFIKYEKVIKEETKLVRDRFPKEMKKYVKMYKKGTLSAFLENQYETFKQKVAVGKYVQGDGSHSLRFR